jgi:hypothetical protein
VTVCEAPTEVTGTLQDKVALTRERHAGPAEKRQGPNSDSAKAAIEKAVTNINTIVFFIFLPFIIFSKLRVLIFEKLLGRIRCRQQGPEPRQKAIRRDSQQWPKA